PYSIALTAAAFHWFQPVMHGFWGNMPNDAEALLQISEKMLSLASRGRLQVTLPVEPRVDVMERLTVIQMRSFLGALQTLSAALGGAKEESDSQVAVLQLRKLFGPEFGSDSAGPVRAST